MGIGMKIKLERIKRNIKQSDLASRLNITPQYLRLIEKEEVDPRYNLLSKISKELGTSVSYLISEEE
jgi:transcriptional regulator with XRE-family HTH domain